jgi:hypothetical protein
MFNVIRLGAGIEFWLGQNVQPHKIVEQMPINAKTPERLCVSGGRYAKMIFALGMNSQALRGLLNQLPMPRWSASQNMLDGVILVSRPPLIVALDILDFRMADSRRSYSFGRPPPTASLPPSRRLSVSVWQ